MEGERKVKSWVERRKSSRKYLLLFVTSTSLLLFIDLSTPLRQPRTSSNTKRACSGVHYAPSKNMSLVDVSPKKERNVTIQDSVLEKRSSKILLNASENFWTGITHAVQMVCLSLCMRRSVMVYEDLTMLCDLSDHFLTSRNFVWHRIRLRNITSSGQTWQDGWKNPNILRRIPMANLTLS